MLVLEFFLILLFIMANTFAVSIAYTEFLSLLGFISSNNKLMYMFVFIVCILTLALLIAFFDKKNQFIKRYARIKLNIKINFLVRLFAFPLILFKAFSFILGTIFAVLLLIVRILMMLIKAMVTTGKTKSQGILTALTQPIRKIYELSDYIVDTIIKGLLKFECGLLFYCSKYSRTENTVNN